MLGGIVNTLQSGNYHVHYLYIHKEFFSNQNLILFSPEKKQHMYIVYYLRHTFDIVSSEKFMFHTKNKTRRLDWARQCF